MNRKSGPTESEIDGSEQELLILNRELVAQNAQLQDRVHELETVNAELNRLLRHAQVSNTSKNGEQGAGLPWPSPQETQQGRDQLLALLAQELRNPLAPIRNVVELLETRPEDLPPSELRRIHAILDRQVTQLTCLVNDLLDTVHLTQGRLTLQKAAVDLKQVVAQAVALVQPFMDKCGHELTVSLPSEPVWLEVDLARMVQVIAQLLNNAAYSMNRAGPIWLLVELEGSQVVLKIIDRGGGIPPAELPRVFDLFYQGNHTVQRSPQGGSGLGLALLRTLVEMHEGTICALSSGHNQGSQFVVRLATVPPGEVPRQVHKAVRSTQSTPRQRHILIVDDNKDLADSLALLLRRHGHVVQTVYDGESALDAIAADRPEVLLLDIGLPDMDGFEVVRRLRKSPLGKAMRLVALTGYSQDDDLQQVVAAGFDQYLVKPVKIEDLQEMLTV